MEEAAPLQTNHAEDGLAENAGVHFACTEHTVYKMIGTSTILNPYLYAVNFISIWKA